MVGLILDGGVCLRWLVSSQTNEFSIGGASVSVAGMGPSRLVGRARRRSSEGCKLTTQGLEHQDPDRSVFLLFFPPTGMVRLRLIRTQRRWWLTVLLYMKHVNSAYGAPSQSFSSSSIFFGGRSSSVDAWSGSWNAPGWLLCPWAEWSYGRTGTAPACSWSIWCTARFQGPRRSWWPQHRHALPRYLQHSTQTRDERLSESRRVTRTSGILSSSFSGVATIILMGYSLTNKQTCFSKKIHKKTEKKKESSDSTRIAVSMSMKLHTAQLALKS